MNSGDRSLSVFLLCALAAIIGLGLILSNCSMKQTEMNRPAEMARIVSEHNLQMACIKSRGVWLSADDDSRPPYSCKFNK